MQTPPRPEGPHGAAGQDAGGLSVCAASCAVKRKTTARAVGGITKEERVQEGTANEEGDVMSTRETLAEIRQALERSRERL